MSREHIAYKCKQPCERWSCQFCDGGLFHCTVCDGFEGSLPTECPGTKMTREQSEAVYDGTLDFRDGQWMHEASGKVGSHYHLRNKT